MSVRGAWNWVQRHRWWVLAVAWAVMLVLGVVGFVRQSHDLDLGLNFLDHLYLTLQLAALDYGGESEAVNWCLQVARFAAPTLAAGTLLQSASVVFREQFARWRAQRARGHTLMCGLGPVGTRLTEALVAEGRRVVAVTTDGAGAGAATARRLGVPVVVGDPTDAEVLDVCRAGHAARVVATTEHDATNVAIAATVASLRRGAHSGPLRCSVRLLDGELAHLLRPTELDTGGSVRLEFFNVHERAARALLDTHPFDTDPTIEPHLVVLGLGQLGRNLVVVATQRWAERQAGPLRVTLVDRLAPGRLHALRMRHPALAHGLAATFVALDLGAPTEDAVEQFTTALREHPPTLVVSAFEDETLAWTSGLFVRRHVEHPVDIVVRTDSDGGFGKHLQGALGGTLGRIATFPFLDRACTLDLIDSGVREQLARALHTDHIRGTDRTARLHRDWDALTDDERASSRNYADFLVEQITALDARVLPLAAWDVPKDVFTDAEVERIAAAQHAAWKAERESQGWAYGPVRDDTARHNPLLVPWADLPEAEREQNRVKVRALPAHLARAGFQISR